MTGIALVLFALAGVHGAELLNADFATLKRRLAVMLTKPLNR